MRYIKLLDGVHFSRKLTRSPRIWRRYLAWWLHANLRQLPGNPPRWLGRFAGKLMPRTVVIIHDRTNTKIRLPVNDSQAERSGLPEGLARLYVFWCCRLAPWIAAMVKPLDSANAHRCDFTDPSNGLLYGGDGGAMNRMFTEFLQSIDESPEAEVELVVDDILRRIAERGDDGLVN